MPLIEISWKDQFLKILLISLLFCTNIVFGNVSLRWVPVSFMQTIKSSVPLFTVVLQRFFFNKSFSKNIYLSMIPIVGGVGLASISEVNYNHFGFYSALASSIISALLAICSGLILKQQLNPINLLYYMTPTSLLMLLPFAYWSEYNDISTKWWPTMGASSSILILVISGVIAFLLNIFTFLVIKYTSPLTYTVSGNLKVIFSITISILIFRNEVSLINAVGCSIAVLGVIWYSQLKHDESVKLLAKNTLPSLDKVEKESLINKV
ncbi:hypothetical protein DLAC_01897 [Tieghemostelium lacteum]|uniref:Sugar phosphate transporter domain-containing protein n=1 Tax=Tieghemostelium lacteum TaxID=361077 RepID=A0A152A6W7_TIELA|nr:hypothetical protein DLAC_01897 [Tieghemostelium lacteum]|eukprot:KYR01875.1 hypothetical protein DLAC_01897 [Tieghemostelium lacteum]